MEAAGLAVGTLALVGVFEDCVTLLSQIGAAKSMEKDYIHLTTRLDFQRTLLLQWGDRLNLYDREKCDIRLDDPILGPLICRGLECILQLLQDGNVLQQRYGVRPADLLEATESSTAVSSRLMSRLCKKPLSFRLRKAPSTTPINQLGFSHQPSGETRKTKRLRCSSDLPQPNNSSTNKRIRRENPTPQPEDSDESSEEETNFSKLDKIKWVIKDKEQFNDLVHKLSDLITDINKVIPPQRGDEPTLEDEIKKLKNVRKLRMIMHSSMEVDSKLADLAVQTIDRVCTQMILDSLWFRLIDDRRNNIPEAHSETLEWALHPPASGVVWDDLSRWLRSGHDVYWIQGKPGSGKSTLMKYLYHHPAVISSLQDWAGDKKLTVASFFLWNIGSAEQSSQEGLARGLLHHVLAQNPGLVPVILPHMWQEAQSGAEGLKIPTTMETKSALQQLGTKKTYGTFAFFIDGLDEFTGDPRDGIKFVQSLATSANVKLLVSSRPIDICVAAFSSAPNLRLQDLTKPDIRAYVNDVVRSHPYVAKMRYLNDTTVESLMKGIRRKAKGVFLWVVLACRALLEGFEAYDNAKELQQRVDELPPELESLFRHILISLPPRFLQQGAKLLRLCYYQRSLCPGSTISAFTLAWAHENEMQILELQEFYKCSLEDYNKKCAMLVGRLRSRCRGLLEVHKSKNVNYHHVDFMHRTVFEFLSTPDVWKSDYLHIGEEPFNVPAVLAYMSCYETYLRRSGILKWNSFEIDNFLHLHGFETESPKDLSRILNRFAFALTRAGKHEPVLYRPNQASLSLGDTSFLIALELNLVAFVQNYDISSFNIRQKRHYNNARQRHNLLFHALIKPVLYEDEFASPVATLACSPAIVSILLRSGSDPNEKNVKTSIGNEYNPTMSPWQAWIDSEHGVKVGARLRRKRSPEETLQVAEITVLMIRAGADTIDYERDLSNLCRDWVEEAANLKNIQDQEKMRGLCDEILEVVPAVRHDEILEVVPAVRHDDSSRWRYPRKHHRKNSSEQSYSAEVWRIRGLQSKTRS